MDETTRGSSVDREDERRPILSIRNVEDQGAFLEASEGSASGGAMANCVQRNRSAESTED